MSPPCLVSVIIPTLRRGDLLYRTLDSLLQQDLPATNLDILVVENMASADAPALPGKYGTVRRLLLHDNYGTTESINRGASQSQSKYLFLLNDDVELDPGCISAMIARSEAAPCAFCGGKLLSARQRDHFDGAGDALLLGGGAFRLGHQDPDTGQYEKEQAVLAGCGAALLFRRDVFQEIGGLDERFFAYLDDVDLCLRAQLAGYQGIYVPRAVAYHIGSATLGDALHPRIVRWMTRNQIYLVLKNYPAPVLLRLLPRISVFQALWFLLNVKRGRAGPYLMGMAGALGSLFPLLGERRRVMKRKRISNSEFLSLLRQSERQLYDWHMQRPKKARSRLMTVYFSLLGRP